MGMDWVVRPARGVCTRSAGPCKGRGTAAARARRSGGAREKGPAGEACGSERAETSSGPRTTNQGFTESRGRAARPMPYRAGDGRGSRAPQDREERAVSLRKRQDVQDVLWQVGPVEPRARIGPPPPLPGRWVLDQAPSRSDRTSSRWHPGHSSLPAVIARYQARCDVASASAARGP